MREISLSPFNRKETTEFIAEALHCCEERLNTLAATLYRKTYGNPFFLGQMLKSVHDENLIIFNIHKGCWEWEMEKIQRLQMPDDVVEPLLYRLKKLPPKTVDILKLASCIGSTFDITTLATACEKTEAEISSLLRPAIAEGLVLEAFDRNKTRADDGSAAGVYEFLHHSDSAIFVARHR